MPEKSSPREVFERLLEGIAARDWDTLAELYAPDAVVDVAFAPPHGFRLEGRAALAEHFATGASRSIRLSVRDLTIHETADPEVIVAEFAYDGLVTTTGRAFHVPNVIVARIRDGLIVSTRDYHNHLVLADALGQLPELMAAFQAA